MHLTPALNHYSLHTHKKENEKCSNFFEMPYVIEGKTQQQTTKTQEFPFLFRKREGQDTNCEQTKVIID